MSTFTQAQDLADDHVARLGGLFEAADRPGVFASQFSGTVVAERHHRRDWWLRRWLAAIDAGSVAVGLLLGGHAWWSLLTLPGWIVLFGLYGLYERDRRRISHTTVDDLPAMFHAIVIGSVALWLVSRAMPGQDVRFGDLLVFAGVSGALMLTLRATVRSASSRAIGAERVLFVGSSPSAEALVSKMRGRPDYGLEPIGALTSRNTPFWPLSLPTLGTLDEVDLAAVVGQHEIDRLVIADRELNDERLLHLLRRCSQLGAKVSVVPAMFGALGVNVEVDHVGGLTVLGVNPPVLSRSSRAMKRAVDVAGAGAALVVSLPLFVAIALAIKLDSRGPIFFRQKRVGKGGQSFEVLKFRSMVVDAEAHRAELLHLSKDPDWLCLEHDPRITRVGRLLRQTSLDELPQFLNVLRGDMSLVGPRPLIEQEDQQVDGWARSRLDLTPGITGLWQVLGRTSIPFEEMVKLDYLYVTNWSLWTDIRLLFLTLPAVLAQRGAN